MLTDSPREFLGISITFRFFPQGDSMNTDEICVEDRAAPVVSEGPSSSQTGSCYWPTSSSLTARLRRLITAYQRSYRREQLKMEAAEKGDRRRRRCEQASKLKEIARQERQQRWLLLSHIIIILSEALRNHCGQCHNALVFGPKINILLI